MPAIDGSENDRLLLDTNAFLYYVTGSEKISRSSLEMIRKAAENSSLFLSVMSIVEIAQLIHIKRLILNFDGYQEPWYKVALQVSGTVELPVTSEIAYLSYNLPGEFHKDPADRLITATALHHGIVLMTSDEKILSYGAAGNFIAVKV